MNSEFEAYVEAIAEDMDATHSVGAPSDGPTHLSWHCEPPMLRTISKAGDGACSRSLLYGEAISYHGLV